MIALGLVLVIAAQSFPVAAFASPVVEEGLHLHHSASMTDGHAGVHHQTAHDAEDDVQRETHDRHGALECSGSVCCGGSCFSFVQLGGLRQEISLSFAAAVSELALSMSQAGLDRPPRLIV